MNDSLSPDGRIEQPTKVRREPILNPCIPSGSGGANLTKLAMKSVFLGIIVMEHQIMVITWSVK